jgi:hypothetical protein
MTRILQLNAMLLTVAFLYGAYHYGLLPAVFAMTIIGCAAGMFLKRVFG